MVETSIQGLHHTAATHRPHRMSIVYDPVTKKLSTEDMDEKYNEQLTALTRLQADLISFGGLPENGNPNDATTKVIQKLVNTSMECLKKHAFNDAIKNLGVAIEASSRRKRWEAFQVSMQEMIGLVQLRCDAYMLSGQADKAFVDADLLVGLTAVSPENFLRRGIALMKLGRFDDARVNFERGLCFHKDHEKLKQHLVIVSGLISRENGDL